MVSCHSLIRLFLLTVYPISPTQPLADVEEEVPKATTMAATATGESKQEIPSINAVHPFHKIQQA